MTIPYKDTDLAYIAGLIDGEGYISISIRKPYKNNGCINPTFKERIQIKMVDEDAIKFISITFNSLYHKEKRSYNENSRPLYYISISDKKAVDVLKILLPYLKVKKRIAEKVLEFRSFRKNPEKVPVKRVIKSCWGKDITVTRYMYSNEYIEKCIEFVNECKDIIHGRK